MLYVPNKGYRPFSSTLLCLLRLSVSLPVKERTLLAKLAISLRFVVLTRDGAMNHTMDSCSFHQGTLSTASGEFSRMDCSLWAACLSVIFLRSFFVRDVELGQEKTVTCSNPGENCKHRPCTLPFCFPPIAFFLLSLNSDGLFLAFAFRWCSCRGSIVSGLKILDSVFSDPKTSLPHFSICDRLGESLSARRPDRQALKVSSAAQNHVSSFCTYFHEYYLAQFFYG